MRRSPRVAFDRVLLGALTGLFALMVLAASPALALATAAPHVSEEPDPDACAMCHRAHSAASDVRYRSLNASDFAGDALVVGTSRNGDKGLCYTCHGVDAIGSNTDVQSAFSGSSVHVLSPGTSSYGPDAKQCSDCHDSHGTDKNASGTPYPALLRVKKTDGSRIFSKEEYCAACHGVRPKSRFDGLEVYRRTAHYTAFPDPSSGTGIRCSVCHASHGSDIAPLIRPTLEPPAIDTTTAVIANDRTLCTDCHASAYATWRGPARYAASIHGTSSAEVTIQAEYADTRRRVGECQSCHAPMGASNGRGGTIAKLGEKEGIALCMTCHTVAGPGLDMSSTVYPAAAVDTAAVIAVYSPDAPTAADGRIQVYSRDTSGTAPYGLTGPRSYAMPGTTARTGAAAAGDVDGDGREEVIVSDPTTATLTIFEQDAMRGIVSGASQVLPIARPADHVGIGDVLPSDGRREIVVVNAAAHELYVYQYSSGSLTLMDGPLETGLDPSGAAIGDVTGSASDDIVVTSVTDATLRVYTESGGSIGAGSSYPAGSGPVGPTIGSPLPSGKREIVVCDSTDQTGSVAIYDGSGNELQRRDVAPSATGVLSASLVADVLPGLGVSAETSEVVVAMSDDTGASSIEIFPRTSGGGLDDPLVVTTGIRYSTGSLASGDVDGDGRQELLAGNGGVWSALGAASRAPSVQVMHAAADGRSIDTAATDTLWGGGVEMAGRAPSVLVADLGRFGPSRHPSGETPDAHVSTETAPFARHVECVDCHDVHEATDTETVAPDLKGVMVGAWGVQVTNVDRDTTSYLGPQAAQYEYEVCFKCHSGWATLDGRRDVARDFNPYNASVHAVEQSSTAASATAGSFVGGWSKDSIMYCTDCHSADAGPKGSHLSSNSPLLVRPYGGTAMSEQTMLCYRCHSRDVYYEGSADSGSSRSYFGSGAHSVHVREHGFSCASCHQSHGSKDQPRMMRDDVGFSYTDASVTCTNDCHSAPGGVQGYSRP